MPSPFPGMDPYIEACGLWGDFQFTFTVRLSGALNRVLRPRFVSLIKRRRWCSPLTAILDPEETLDRYLQILDMKANQRIVTVIDVLMPDTKNDKAARETYTRHQQKMGAIGANLIEIDLLHHDGPNGIKVTRHRPAEQVSYRVPLQNRLPRIFVPLVEPTPDVILDLQAVYTECWDEGPYDALLSYCDPPSGRLTPEELTWCEEILRSAGHRAREGMVSTPISPRRQPGVAPDPPAGAGG